MAQREIKYLVDTKPKPVQLFSENILVIVCEYLHVDPNDVRGKRRTKEIVQARQIAMYFCDLLTQDSLKTIGSKFGRRDHSTVIHARKKVKDHMATDKHYRKIVEDLQQRLHRDV